MNQVANLTVNDAATEAQAPADAVTFSVLTIAWTLDTIQLCVLSLHYSFLPVPATDMLSSQAPHIIML